MATKTIITFLIFILQFPYFLFFKVSKSLAGDNLEVKLNYIDNDLNQKKNNNWYILGPGDSIFIDFKNIPFFSASFLINKEGLINNLPEIDSIYAKGLTIEELESKLTQKFQKFVFNPSLNISILTYRPITVFVNGEVKRSGIYDFETSKVENRILPQGRNNNSLINQSKLFQETKDLKFVRLFDLLKKAGGVTNYADLSNITVIRDNPISQGGGKIKAKVNLLSLLEKGDQDQNIRLLDGDSIFVNKGGKMLKDQILSINKSNLSPDKITVYITGNVVKQGPINLEQGASLIQAIASSGGKKFWTGKIAFVRFNSDGETVKSVFNYDPNAPINTKKNPILMSGDIINVRKTILGTTSQVIGEISSPIVGSYGLYKIFTD
mgnify:CR=1 FL=1